MKTTKNKWILLGMTALVLSFGLGLSGCATYSTVSGARTPFGALTSSKVNEGRGEAIAQYKVILGLFTSGYKEFLQKTDGKEVDIVGSSFLGIVSTFKAVNRN